VREPSVPRIQLFKRLARAGRVTVVCATAGSGKTCLLRSWAAYADLEDSLAWVPVQPEEHDAQRFWISVVDALRATDAGSRAVRPVTPAPDLHAMSIVEQLLEDLHTLEHPLWLVIDDLHELRSADALRELESLCLRAPPALRLVLSTRSEPRLGLHRLRLEGELTEIRSKDLIFSIEETRQLFEATGVELSESAVARLHARTEGWAAGLRLAALSMEHHPDPDRFAAEFCGSERTVSEYIMAEVLDRQPPDVRRLLLRTSVLEWLNGPLAERLTGGSTGERVLRELEDAGACVISLDASRSRFRYHPLFAEFLRLQLRLTSPGETRGLRRAAAWWYAENGYPVEAVRQAQAAEDWSLAARLLADNWTGLEFGGRRATAHALLAAFPAGAIRADPELAAMSAAAECTRGSLEACERHLALAAHGAASVPGDRRGRLQVWLTLVRLVVASRRGNLPAAVEGAERLLRGVGDTDPMQLAVPDEYRAMALLTLGETELSTFHMDDAEEHLRQGIALARAKELPFLEVAGLAEFARVANMRSAYSLAAQRSSEAIRLAEQHGWTQEPVAGIAYAVLGGATLMQGRIDEAAAWLVRAERALRAEGHPAVGASLHLARGLLAILRDREGDALAAFRAAEQLAEHIVEPKMIAERARACVIHALARTGETDRAERELATMDEDGRGTAEMRTAIAALRLAQDDPDAATAALEPILSGVSVARNRGIWLLSALVLEARARRSLGDAGGAERALERALDLAEPEGMVLPFLMFPEPELLERHRRHRTSHAALVSRILSLLAGNDPLPAASEVEPPLEPLSESELRVLRYLPTNLSAPEIASELYVAPPTVKTHMQHIYAKLGAHRRADAVERARALGLLAPSALKPR
jgi:LuxR family transcriptional regulator, maltose regulon positive regulatory protein